LAYLEKEAYHNKGLIQTKKNMFAELEAYLN